MFQQPDLAPEEILLARILKQAIKDAQQSSNERLREEALAFLWTVAPTIAQRAELPQIHASNGVATDNAPGAPWARR